jgi:hypothetical protein
MRSIEESLFELPGTVIPEVGDSLRFEDAPRLGIEPPKSIGVGLVGSHFAGIRSAGFRERIEESIAPNARLQPRRHLTISHAAAS